MFGNHRFITIFDNFLLPNQVDLSANCFYHFSTSNALILRCNNTLILHLIIILSFSKVSSLKEHLSGLKALPAMLSKHSTGADVALLDEKKQLFSHSTRNVLLCNNLCPVSTHIQVAITKVIRTFSHEIAIFNNKRFNTFE